MTITGGSTSLSGSSNCSSELTNRTGKVRPIQHHNDNDVQAHASKVRTHGENEQDKDKFHSTPCGMKLESGVQCEDAAADLHISPLPLLLAFLQSVGSYVLLLINAVVKIVIFLVTSLLAEPLYFIPLLLSFVLAFLQAFVAVLILSALLITAVYDDLRGRRHGHWLRHFIHALFFKNLKHTKMTEFIGAEGYHCESHQTSTEDGYLLTLYKITSPHAVLSSNRPPILLQHGLFNTSMSFCFGGRGEALAFALADAGYEVWLGNNRGNFHSRKHQQLNAYRHSSYWRFSINELVFDVKAFYSYILSQPQYSQLKNPKLIYIGHSQGSTQALMALSQHEELVQQTALLVCLAPAAYVNEHAMNPMLRSLSRFYHSHPNVFYWVIGRNAFFPILEYARMIMSHTAWMFVSQTMFNFLFHWSVELWNPNTKARYFHETPSYSSIDNTVHWLQLAAHGKFAAFIDYAKYPAEQRAQLREGVCELPLNQVCCPTLLIHGGRDRLIDARKLEKQLPNVIERLEVPHHFHLDALASQDAPTLVYPKILNAIQNAHTSN